MFLAILLVISSGLIHSIWNLFAKKSEHKATFLWFCQLSAFIICLPWVMIEWSTTQFYKTTYMFIFLAILVHGIYMILLSKSYTIGDLSKMYPIMRGISPIAVPIVSVLFLNEHLTMAGWIGVSFILFGIYSLGNHSFSMKIKLDRDIALATLVGCCIAVYMIIDKLALTYLSPIILNLFINVGSFVALSLFVPNTKTIKMEWKKNWGTIILGGLLIPASFLVFLYALSLAEVSQLAPMREIGTVFGTFLGIIFLKETQGQKRIISSVIITIGVVVLGIWG